MKKYIILILVLAVLFLLINNVSAENSTIVNLQVENEYGDNINPEISIIQDNVNLKYEKEINKNNSYKITINNTDKSKIYTITVSQQGYIPEIQNITINSNLTNNLVFNLNATKIYKIGYGVTTSANKLMDFSSSDDVLVITTAGMTRINNVTTENALDGIINAAKGYITYGKGNILTLSSTRTDPTDFAFFVKKGKSLTMAFYKNGSINPIYYGDVGIDLSNNQWKELQNLLGNEEAYTYISIANAWSNGLYKDILTLSSYHGHVCTGLICGQAMVNTLMMYYPPRGETGAQPLENTAYYVLGVPGGSDDDAFTWTMDVTPGKMAYIGIDTMENKNMVGFLRWNAKNKTGILVIMSYDENSLKESFKKKYSNIDPDRSLSEDLKYQNWLILTLMNNPESLVKIEAAYKNLNEDMKNQLIGNQLWAAQNISAHGLDLNYIEGLNLPKADIELNKNKVTPISDYKLKKIGRDASLKAIEFFKKKNITIEKDMSNFYVLTGAGFVRINDTVTSMVFDGIDEVLGSRLSRATCLPVHTAIWKDLIIEFYWLNTTNIYNSTTFSLKYNPISDEINETTQQYNLQDRGLRYNPSYDALIGWLFHNHICTGSSPGILLADKIFNELPLEEDEEYILVSTYTYCKDDTLSRLLGVSPGMGNYYNLAYSDSNVNAGAQWSANSNIIIKWNSKTNTGTATIIKVGFPIFKSGVDEYEEWARLLKGDYTSKNLISAPSLNFELTKPISESDLKIIVSGAKNTVYGNSLKYIQSLPDILPNIPENHELNEGLDNVTKLSNNNGNPYSYTTSILSDGSKSNVGLSSNLLTSNIGGEDSSNDGKSYEVSKKITSKKTKSNDIIYAIAFVFLIGTVLSYGFMRNRK